MKIYNVIFESNVDGEMMFEAVPCATEEIAKRVLKEQRDLILNESLHFSNLTDDDMDEMEIVDTDEHFYINDQCDDYYEDYYIEEKDVISE
jgi:hypothetical protein